MSLRELITANADWAASRAAASPSFFPELASGQTPDTLWIGCADSRVPPGVITGSDPGRIFVHRNVANVVSPSDLNAMAVVEYAVAHLKVGHIILCGHASCGGVAAVVDGIGGGLLGHWLAPITAVADQNRDELMALPDREARVSRLVELNVHSQVASLQASPPVRAAWDRGQPLEVHGCVFDLGSGKLREICTTSGPGGG